MSIPNTNITFGQTVAINGISVKDSRLKFIASPFMNTYNLSNTV